MLPVKMERLSREHIVDMSVGRRHCTALSMNGDVFGWGYHQHNQCGFLVETTGTGLGDRNAERALQVRRHRKTLPRRCSFSSASRPLLGLFLPALDNMIDAHSNSL